MVTRPAPRPALAPRRPVTHTCGPHWGRCGVRPVSLGFFDDILIPPADLQENTALYVGGRARPVLAMRADVADARAWGAPTLSNTEEQAWVWTFKKASLYMDDNEEIRFRVQSEVFVDAMPAAVESGLSALPGAEVSRKPSLDGHRTAPYSILVRPPRHSLPAPHPLTDIKPTRSALLQGGINQPGLGLLTWWTETE